MLPRRVRNFRESLSECVLPTYESFIGSGIAEANEFLKYILSMFPDEDWKKILHSEIQKK